MPRCTTGNGCNEVAIGRCQHCKRDYCSGHEGTFTQAIWSNANDGEYRTHRIANTCAHCTGDGKYRGGQPYEEALAEYEAEIAAWRRRVQEELGQSEPIAQLIRIVGRFRPQAATVANEVLGPHSWTLSQVAAWFPPHACDPGQPLKTVRTGAFGRERPSSEDGWVFNQAATVTRKHYDETRPADIAITTDGRALIVGSGRFWRPVDTASSVNFSYAGLGKVFEATDLQPVEAPPTRPKP